jgi:hypothetical protein
VASQAPLIAGAAFILILNFKRSASIQINGHAAEVRNLPQAGVPQGFVNAKDGARFFVSCDDVSTARIN